MSRTLQRPAVAVPEVLQSPELVPAAAGFYGWWSRRGALAAIPHVPHPLDEDLSLLYVGISPARETSRQTVRARVTGNHGEIEGAVIALLTPPLNSAGNAAHAFYPAVRAARAEFRRRARVASPRQKLAPPDG